MPKKVLYLRTEIYNGKLIAGGSVTHTVGVIEGFIAAGYDVVCAASIMLEQLRKIDLQALYTLKNPKQLSFLRWKINCILSNLFFTIRALLIMRKQSFDLIYQRYSILNCVGIVLSAFKKVPLILEYNGSELWVDTHWSVRKRWLNFSWLIARVEHWNLTYADHIVVVSDALRDELLQRGYAAHKILVNPNGVNTDFFDPSALAEQRANVRAMHHLNNAFVFGFIGTFSPWHGVELLQEMIPQVVARNPRAHFLLIGDGPRMQALKESLSAAGIGTAHVTFTGIVPSQKARDYLAACDAFLCPTQPNPDGTPFFGSPTKVFEYLSMGKPVIASALDQVAQLVYPALRLNAFDEQEIHESVGIVVPPTSVDSFVAAACTLMEMPQEQIVQLGANARQKAVQNYQWNDHVRRIISFAHLE